MEVFDNINQSIKNGPWPNDEPLPPTRFPAIPAGPKHSYQFSDGTGKPIASHPGYMGSPPETLRAKISR